MSTVILPLEADQTRLTTYMRHGLSAILLSLSLSIASCQEPAPRAPRPDYPPQTDACDFFDKTSDMKKIWMGITSEKHPDVQVQIPGEYLRREYNGQSDGAILMRIRITDFAPNDGRPTPKSIPRVFGTMLYTAPNDLNVDVLIKLGLTLSATPDVDHRVPLAKARPSEFDLLELSRANFDQNFSPGIYNRDLYVNLSSDRNVSDLIYCSRADQVPSPGCRHEISDDTIGISLSYRRTFLPDWKKIGALARRFTDCAYLQSRTVE